MRAGISPGFLGRCWLMFCLLLPQWSHAQDNGFERAFPQSKAMVEKALREMQRQLRGRLPVLDGFAYFRIIPWTTINVVTTRRSSRSRRRLPGDRLCG